MPLKIKLLEIQLTLFSMLKDWSEESSPITSYKKIVNFGHSKLKLLEVLKINQLLLLNIRVNSKNSTQKKFHLWFSLKWRKPLKLSYLKKFNTPLLPFPLISMILKDKPPKMLDILPVSTFSELSMNQLPLLLLTVLIKKELVKETFWSSILVVVLLMYLYLLLMMVSLKSKLLLEILI